MRRSFSCTALVLRVKPSGDSNREAWFLTDTDGLLHATLFGGPRSRLRAHAAPYNQGTLWYYHDPVRDSRKVSDFDVKSWRPALRERYERTMAAGAVAETVLTSHGGGGNWGRALELAGGALDAVETADEKTCSRILVHFLWNWAAFLGLRPDINSCAACACEAPRGGELWYDTREECLLCSRCFHGGTSGFPVGPGARLWFHAVENLDSAAAARYSLDTASLSQAKALATGVLSAAFGKRLRTWDL
jgi:DNA repair protein RecO (recombination protein O)